MHAQSANREREREGESGTNTTTIDAAAGALYDVRDTLVGVGRADGRSECVHARNEMMAVAPKATFKTHHVAPHAAMFDERKRASEQE